MKLHNYTEQLLSLYNFYDGGIMVNKDCVIEYYHNNRPDINTLSESEMIGKTIFEIYPSVNEKKQHAAAGDSHRNTDAPALSET